MADNTLYPYVIVLRNETASHINTSGFILSLGSAILFLREMIIRNMIILPYLIGIIFIIGLLVRNAIIYYKQHKEIYYSKALLIAGLVWTRMPYAEWLVIVFALLSVLEYQAKLRPEIGFSNDHIVFNGLIKKRYPWSVIDNVILKDGLLTIDFKNNKLFQKEIDSEENEAVEQEFNAWCKNNLAEDLKRSAG